jgi:protein-L-isoaspartate O-methyltransferase
VPGCGKGYDVALLAGLEGDNGKKLMEKVVGLDVSSRAVEEATRRFEGEIQGQGNIQFVRGDFFGVNESWKKEGPYDVVYDYTVISHFFANFLPESRFPSSFSHSTGIRATCLGVVGDCRLSWRLIDH